MGKYFFVRERVVGSKFPARVLQYDAGDERRSLPDSGRLRRSSAWKDNPPDHQNGMPGETKNASLFLTLLACAYRRPGQ